jgi:hypothetical protein
MIVVVFLFRRSHVVVMDDCSLISVLIVVVEGGYPLST